MDEDISGDDIARIEEHIEELREGIAHCRKLSLAAKLTIGGGGVWIVLTFLWLVPYVPYLTIAAAAAVIGGIVLLGSNATTWDETKAALGKSEAMRAEWIGRKEMRLVGDNETLH